MKRRFLTILLLFTYCITLFPQEESIQQKTDCMEQKGKKTELNYFENPRYANKPNEFVAEDGNYICRYSRSVYEYTPPETFQMIQRLYNENGTPEIKISYILHFSLLVEEYDENGFLTKKTDYESSIKDKKLDGMDYATFFEKEGWYDRSTGQTAFREEPYPLNTGEFTKKVFKCFYCTSNDSTICIRINNIEKVPQQFLDKYGTVGEDGVKYLERKNDSSKWARLEVFYIIDTQTNTYKVDWGYILSIE